MDIELLSATTVEFALFEKFCYAIILFEEKKENGKFSKEEFFDFVATYLGGGMTGGNARNFFSKSKIIGYLQEWRYMAFCKTFTNAFNALKPTDQNRYKEIKASFDTWKLRIDKRHDVVVITDRELPSSDLPPFPAYLENSTWYTYALHETTKTRSVIGRMVMEFGKANSNEVDVTLTHYVKNYGIWKGKAHFNRDFCLVITITKASNQVSYNHYLFATSKHLDSYDLLVGHNTIKNSKLEKSVTKIVLLEKCLDKIPQTAAFDLDSPKLPQGYGDFLKRKEFQPLFAPSASSICNYETLKAWLEHQESL